MDTDNIEPVKEITIVGGGLAGCLLGWRLHNRGVKVVIYDDSDPFSSSKVAAGVINPVSGMRLAKNWRMDELLPAAKSLYSDLEKHFNQQFYFPIPIYRMLKNSKEEKIIENRLNDPEYSDYLKMADFKCANHPVIQIQQGAFVKIDLLAQRIREFFTSQGQWFDKTWTEDSGSKWVIFCQGYRGKENEIFNHLPFRLSRGETLMLESEQDIDYLINTGKWLFPWDKEKKLFRAGATYEWENLLDEPSEKAKNEILQGIQPFIEENDISFTIQGQFVGIRSNTQNNLPLIGKHPEFTNRFIFNGFGSKGALTIPWCAEQMAEYLLGDIQELPSDIQLPDAKAKKMPRVPLTVTAQNKIAEVLNPGDYCVDATVGNGHDTVFLAEKVGSTGKVIGFDIQDQAIQSTKNRIADKKLEQQVQLIPRGHEHIKTELENLGVSQIKSCMFNLGYLPNGDKSILTLPGTTERAITQSIQLLEKGGRITILVYVGHDGGSSELDVVDRLFLDLSNSDFDTEIIRANVQNPKAKPPILYILTKR